MDESFLRIGQLAARAGVSADSIRHYERLGLLPKPARTDGGYRLFSPVAVERVQLIRNAVRVGFSLRQLAAFLGERQAGGAPCRKVRDAAGRILASVDDQIADLQTTKASLRLMLKDWDDRLAHTPTNQPARLLDALGPTRAPSRHKAHPKVRRGPR